VSVFGGLIIVFSLGALSRTAPSPAKIVGPNRCAECHKEEAEAWKTSHHFKTFRELPRRKEATEIAEKMGVQRLRSEGLCLTCHYTVQQKDNRMEPIAGISCESCHSAGEDWIKVHSGFSGKSEKTETKAEAAARLKRADAAGMIRPASVYDLAKNCYGCHVVPQEDLVNKGGHTAGSDFELVAWSQGEVRHNTWTSKGKANTAASPQRKRMLYLLGLGVELETSMRAVGRSSARKLYAFEMAKRVDVARRQLATVAKALPNAPEIGRIVELGYANGLKLNNERGLTTSADQIAKLLEAVAEKYDGSTLAALDPFLPPPTAYKGTPRPPGGAN
jgi:hypothetical protein